jgi:hypothetical protein
MPSVDTDAFTYSDGDLATVSAAKWTKQGPGGIVDCKIVSNQLTGASGNDSQAAITTWSGSATDHYSQATIKAVSSADNSGPCVRGTGTSTSSFYLLGVTTNATTDVFKCVAGSYTSISNTSITWAANDTAYLEVQGTTIISKQNGTTRHNFTNNVIASGKPSWRFGGNGITFDDWDGGDFASGAGPVGKSYRLSQAVNRAATF